MNAYESIIKGLQEAISYESGNGTARTVKCTVNPAPDYDAKQIKDVRNSLGLTQIAFAEVTGVSPKRSKRGKLEQTSQTVLHED